MNGRNPEMKKELVTRLHKSFEDAVHHQEGTEYWLARELQELLGYTTWRSFEQVVDKAKTACAKARVPVAAHFAAVDRKSVVLGKSVSVRVDLGGPRIIIKKTMNLVVTHSFDVTLT